MSELYTSGKMKETNLKETSRLHIEKSEISKSSVRELSESVEKKEDLKNEIISKTTFDKIVESVSEDYGALISETDRQRIVDYREVSSPTVISEEEYISRFPENDFNVLGHYDPVNEQIYIKDRNNEVIQHVMVHEAIHHCSHNEIGTDNDGNTVIRSGIRETVISEGGVSDHNRGINEGLTEMYTLRELNKGGNIEAAESVTSYPEARRYACMMEEIIGDDMTAKAYYGGDLEKLKAEFNRLNEEDQTAWDSFSKDVETVEYGIDHVEIAAARTRLSIMLMEMSDNKEARNG